MRHLLYQAGDALARLLLSRRLPQLDEQNWKCFVNSRCDPVTREWTMSKRPYIQVVP